MYEYGLLETVKDATVVHFSDSGSFILYRINARTGYLRTLRSQRSFLVMISTDHDLLVKCSSKPQVPLVGECAGRKVSQVNAKQLFGIAS